MRTLLFGLDGATDNVLDPLIARGVMPVLKQFRAEGTRCTLESTAMPITPQAWTSLATGHTAGYHGIHDFLRFERGAQGLFFRFNDSREIQCETIWTRASQRGQQVTLLNYVCSAPPLAIHGHSIPGFMPTRYLKRSSHPRDLVARLEALPGVDLKALGSEMDIERQVLQDMPRDQWQPWIQHHIERDRVWCAILEHLLRHEPSNLTAIVFDGVDKLQHLAYRYLDPQFAPTQPDAWEREVLTLCEAYFRQIDQILGRCLEILGPDSRVFIASDHGFTATTEVFYVNKWLHDRGWLRWKRAADADTQEAIFTANVADHLQAIDWSASRAYALTPSCNGVFLNVPAAEYAAFRQEVTDGLLAIRAADGGQVVTEVRPRETWFPGPYSDRAPDLTLVLRDFGLLSVLNGPAVVVPRKAASGTHHPHGILLGRGPGIPTGRRVAPRPIIDVAPLLLHSIGLDIPADYEGQFPETFYTREYLAGDPPRIADSTAGETPGPAPVTGGAPAAVAEMETEDEAEVLARLRSLGYIE